MFSLEMSKEQKMIKNEVAKLVKDLVIENAGEMEGKKEIPLDSVQKAWELGASVSMVAEDLGGFGMEDSPITTAISDCGPAVDETVKQRTEMIGMW